VTAKVLIAAPIYQRAWILEHWLRCIEQQNHPLDHLGFLFELGPDDDDTHNILWEWQSRHPEIPVFDAQIDITRPHSAHAEGKRHWNQAKYANMVKFRNSLLERATALSSQFDYYFSLDSDLLLEDPTAITQLIEDCQDPDVHVVSPLSYMTPRDKAYPSIMYWEGLPGGRAIRNHSKFQPNSLYKVDIVMAAVFMCKEVFTRARYCLHKQGEDLGFATDLARLGFNSYTDTRVYANHIMHKATLESYLNDYLDPRKPKELV
jgi:hypothetical protein